MKLTTVYLVCIVLLMIAVGFVVYDNILLQQEREYYLDISQKLCAMAKVQEEILVYQQDIINSYTDEYSNIEFNELPDCEYYILG